MITENNAMRLPGILNLSFALFLMNGAFGQSANNTAFIVTGKILGRYKGLIRLPYTDLKIGNTVELSILKNGNLNLPGN